MKLCADFKRTGMDFNWWVLRSDFRLPSEEELRTMVTPEQCCAHFSMMAASQRLKDAGYGDKFFLNAQEDDDEDGPMDDEEKLAPWNTTRAYIQAMDNKCLLQLTWPDDPTGCTKGLLYVRVPHKPTANKEEQEAQPKVVVNGTNADLRKLSLSKATAILRKHGLPDEEIKKLSRWEVIDAVRTVSTEKAKAGEKGMIFSRGNRYSTAELLERYKEECQRLFDLQNKVMASDAELSTDEDESSDEDQSELEEMGKNVEDILTLGKTVDEIDYEREEQERLQMKKTFMGDGSASKEAPEQKDVQPELTGRVLMIYRTFEDAQGKRYVRQELVRNPEIIDVYLRIRTTKGKEVIKQFTAPDEQEKVEMRRNKKRIQEQLRRLTRNKEKEKQGTSSQPRKNKMKQDVKLKCGACGQVGHMRTNKGCPQFHPVPIPAPSLTSIEKGEEAFDGHAFSDDEDLMVVDGTKVKLTRKFIKRLEEDKSKSLKLKLPKDVVQEAPKEVVKKRPRADSMTLYELPHRKTSNRQRKDPKVTLSTMLEEIVNEMRHMPDVDPFLLPVSKSVPNYHTIIQRPMDLQTIRRNVQQMKYSNREEFLVDVNQMVENSTRYNGDAHVYTITAKKILELCGERLVEKDGQFMELEKAINPLLDGSEQVAFSFVLSNIIYGKLRQLPEAWPFLKPVNKKMVKDYYSIIKNPMDLERILQKIQAHKYQDRQAFLQDMMLILKNCITYNGAEHEYTNKARSLVQTCQETLNEVKI